MVTQIANMHDVIIVTVLSSLHEEMSKWCSRNSSRRALGNQSSINWQGRSETTGAKCQWVISTRGKLEIWTVRIQKLLQKLGEKNQFKSNQDLAKSTYYEPYDDKNIDNLQNEASRPVGPNSWHTSYTWFEQISYHMCIWKQLTERSSSTAW